MDSEKSFPHKGSQQTCEASQAEDLTESVSSVEMWIKTNTNPNQMTLFISYGPFSLQMRQSFKPKPEVILGKLCFSVGATVVGHMEDGKALISPYQRQKKKNINGWH